MHYMCYFMRTVHKLSLRRIHSYYIEKVKNTRFAVKATPIINSCNSGSSLFSLNANPAPICWNRARVAYKLGGHFLLTLLALQSSRQIAMK